MQHSRIDRTVLAVPDTRGNDCPYRGCRGANCGVERTSNLVSDEGNEGNHYQCDTSQRRKDFGSRGQPKRDVQQPTRDIRRAIDEPVSAIVDAVKITLDKTPPELSADIMTQGIVLTGGGALLHGLDVRLQNETNMPHLLR